MTSDQKSQVPPSGVGRKSVLREYLEAIGIALAVALLLRFFVVEAFKIPSGSMVETLAIGDFIFVNKMAYRAEVPYTALSVRVPFGGTTIKEWSKPERGEVIVFRFPTDQKVDYIKRVVGVPGDLIEIRDNQLLVNGKTYTRSYQGKVSYQDQHCRFHSASRYLEDDGQVKYPVLLSEGSNPFEDFGPVRVKDDHLFMMGDNRDNSSDSRAWGQVPIELVKGRAMFVWLSLDRCAALSGRVRTERFGQAVR
ncbi:MAG: signal peptidase I [Rickettsiales bacterium]|nr:signal peptidase I [Rickettsiales bacterium]|tara:strand:+ start:5613 stop:6365 length:753 start_codon:yes stop_codon:yes gene_type:complete